MHTPPTDAPQTIAGNGAGLGTGPDAAAAELAALRQREKQLSDFIERVAVPLHWVGEDGTILWANEAELRLLGYTREEYVGRNIVEFHADESSIAEILNRLKNDDEVAGIESRLRCKDGSLRYVRIHSSVYREQGRFVHTRCVTIDISDEQRFSELQGRLAAIVESSDDAIISKDLGGTIRSWNRGAQRIFGYTADEIIGRHVSVLATPDRVDEIPIVLARIARGEVVDHYETRRKTKAGKILTVSLTVSPIRDAFGVIVGASKVARDITEQTRLTEIQERLAAIVECSDDAIISKNLDGIIQSWNRGAQRLFGYASDEIIGKHISTLAAPGYVDEIPNILDRLRRGDRVDHYETKRRTKDGKILTVSLSVSPIRNGFGVIIGASKVARDITEREINERRLLEANAALTRSNADLQQFAHSASHDLQEPLRMVASYGEMLERKFGGTLGPQGEEYISYIVQGAARMDQLLKDLRMYTYASTEGDEPAIPIDAEVILEGTLVGLERAITESGAEVTHTALPRVFLHEFQLEQLFQNLIGNAIRYHRRGVPPRIHIAAEQQSDEWVFSVKDNGIGIDQKYKEDVFGIFKRLHNNAEYPGTGMGLAICKRIVERARGRIWVESEPGRGATFFFAIPGKS